MELTKSLWHRAVLLDKEFSRRGEKLSRKVLQDALMIPQALSQHVIFSLENQEIIRFEAESFNAGGQRGILFADHHIPFGDKLCMETILSFADEFKPDFIIILGDLIDFYEISTFITDPAKRDTNGEIKATKAFLEHLRSRYPDAEIYYKEGNHEYRLERFIIKNAAQIYSLISDLLTVKLNIEELKIKYITEPFRIGKLWFLHGHEKPAGSYNPEYICNVMWKYVHDHFIVGHFHRQQKKIFKDIGGQTYWTASVGYSAGALDYAPLNQWTQGFISIQFDDSGAFRAQQYDVLNGVIY